VGISGQITLPVQETIPIQASVASAVGPGYSKVRVDDFHHLEYLSVGAVESHVVSSFSEKDNAHGTLSCVVVDELNTMHVVTCDRMMLRLTSKHDVKDKHEVAQASFILHGTHFDNLRIAGHKIDLDLAVGLFSELSTWDKLNYAYENDPAIRKELDELALFPQKKGHKLPTYKGMFACTLSRIPKKLPHGLSHAKEHGIYVPHFGTIYPTHYYITETSRRLHMMHIDLGCSVEGCNSYGSGGANGQQIPGN
jgi:hypothetical protein